MSLSGQQLSKDGGFEPGGGGGGGEKWTDWQIHFIGRVRMVSLD